MLRSIFYLLIVMKYTLRAIVTNLVLADPALVETIVFDREFSVNCVPMTGEYVWLRAVDSWIMAPITKQVVRVGHEDFGKSMQPVVIIEESNSSPLVENDSTISLDRGHKGLLKRFGRYGFVKMHCDVGEKLESFLGFH
jgi:hypothetical protein